LLESNDSSKKVIMTTIQLPYHDIRVVEFTHMVMGPTCGMILADLGAEVIKVEPIEGDKTRELLGSGAGFFSMFNRNKKSISVNLKTPEGRKVVEDLIATADVVIENFKAGTMQKLGLDYATLSKKYPRLIYVSNKGFLPGPYDHRTALDEVVQMMGGLAYMTGPKGRPLRAGTSVNDMMGGIFGAIGVMAALRNRDQTGCGEEIQTGLFENNVFLVGQHMLQYAVTGKAADPMPSRISSWGIYDIFEVKNQEQIFLGVVTDTQWEIFCRAFDWSDLQTDPKYATNNLRVTNRDTLIPILRSRFTEIDAEEITKVFEANGLPYAPITKPEELFNDPHLLATGGIATIEIPTGAKAGSTTKTPLLPLTIGGQRLGVRLDPPYQGAHTKEILTELGLSAATIEELIQKGITVAKD
jgi:crotonobetainyl-CoA:carnitine CoA-transferase CaiB-like acyl-CoA transferase